MTIKYWGYEAAEGTTSISFFYGDMHTYDIRADKVIKDMSDLKDQVERFRADQTQFDYMDYNCQSKFVKAAREYSTPVKRRVHFEELVFIYDGQAYKIKTRKHSVVSKIKKNTSDIISHKQIQTMCLVDDATDEMLGEGNIIGEVDLLLEWF